MKKMVRCKACGYVMEEGQLGDKCPACGAPKVAFLPWVDPMGASRRRLLSMDLHPIAVHFPTSLSAAVLVFILGIAILSGEAQSLLISTVKILVIFIPFLVLIAGILGVIDGKTRFRKIRNSQILKRKIAYASVLLVFSIVLWVVVWTRGFDGMGYVWLDAILAAVMVGLTAVLGLLGTSLLDSAFPGN